MLKQQLLLLFLSSDTSYKSQKRYEASSTPQKLPYSTVSGKVITKFLQGRYLQPNKTHIEAHMFVAPEHSTLPFAIPSLQQHE